MQAARATVLVARHGTGQSSYGNTMRGVGSLVRLDDVDAVAPALSSLGKV